jgi:hypothetical protein
METMETEEKLEIKQFKDSAFKKNKMSTCQTCKKCFRDSYDLKRHLNKKIPCTLMNKKNDKTPSKGNNITIINNNIININIFGSEDLSHINIESIIEEWRNINKITNEEYIRAGKLITSFHGMVNQNPLNHNVLLQNPKSIVTKMISPTGVISKPTNEVIDQTIKTRAGQLVNFKESIEEHNDRVFQSKKNINTWKHIEKFNKLGTSHTDSYTNTRDVRTNMKVALLNG